MPPVSALPVSLISAYPLLIIYSRICDMLVCFNVNYCFHSGGEKNLLPKLRWLKQRARWIFDMGRMPSGINWVDLNSEWERTQRQSFMALFPFASFEPGAPSRVRGCLVGPDLRLPAGTAAVSKQQQQLPDPEAAPNPRPCNPHWGCVGGGHLI